MNVYLYMYMHMYICLCVYILDCTQICAILHTCGVFDLPTRVYVYI